MAQAAIAVIAVDDDFTRAIAARREHVKRPTIRVSETELRYRAGARPRRHRLVARQSQRPAARAARRRRADARHVRRAPLRGPCAAFTAARAPHVGAAQRQGRVTSSSTIQGDECRTREALACFPDIFWILGGKPKTGGIESLREFFPRMRKAYLIGGGGAGSRARSMERCLTRCAARSTARWPTPRATPRRQRHKNRWCCSRRPARRSTSTAISRSAATRSANW